jgi:hypothetical protein
MDATSLPSTLIAGTTTVYTRTLDDYPAPEWTFTLALRGRSELDVVATASGSAHLVTISATASAGLLAGQYRWAEMVERGVDAAREVYPIARGEITVEPDLLAAAAGDLQSTDEQLLALIRAELVRRATGGDIESYQVGGGDTAITRRPTKELEQRVDQLEGRINARKRRGAFQGVRLTYSSRTRLA